MTSFVGLTALAMLSLARIYCGIVPRRLRLIGVAVETVAAYALHVLLESVAEGASSSIGELRAGSKWRRSRAIGDGKRVSCPLSHSGSGGSAAATGETCGTGLQKSAGLLVSGRAW